MPNYYFLFSYSIAVNYKSVNLFYQLDSRSRPRAASRALQTRFRRSKRSADISSKPKRAQNRSKNWPKNWQKRKPFERLSIKTNVNRRLNLLRPRLCNNRNSCIKKKLKLKLNKLLI